MDRPASSRTGAHDGPRASRSPQLPRCVPHIVRRLALGLLLWAGGCTATQPALLPPDELKGLTVEELMDIEVFSASRQPERVSTSASAIQLIPNETIRRSGATRLPEALRLAPNLQVAQVNAHDWAITARGFNGAPLANNSLANKLLVMIDGRTVYTPLFGGVFWDVQNVLLEDVDRIEVISGPGGALWGANAVNGVIQVITKEASETQGLYASASAGSFMRAAGALRYGGRIGRDLHYRVYGQHLTYDSTAMPDGDAAGDAWAMTQGGFRMDYAPSSASTLTLQGDVYGGNEGDPTTTRINGQNLLFRWARQFSETSQLYLQTYFDRAWRKLPEPSFRTSMATYNADFQHDFLLGERHNVLWGTGLRLMQNDVTNTESLSFFPERRTMHVFSGFVQDQIGLVPDRLSLTLGAKLEHNDFSGFEIQPTARLAWTPSPRHTLWTAASRAVHAPSRFDADVATPNLTGNPDFASENVMAFKVGYRVRPVDDVSLSMAVFYNRYDDLRSINLNPAPPPALMFANDHEARAGGVEASGAVQMFSWWRLRGGYTYLTKSVAPASDEVFEGSDLFEGLDPNHQAVLHSFMDLPGGFQFDLVARYVDALPRSVITPPVPEYITVDAHIAWQQDDWTVSIVGQNLWEDQHSEFGEHTIPRSLYGNVAWRY